MPKNWHGRSAGFFPSAPKADPMDKKQNVSVFLTFLPFCTYSFPILQVSRSLFS